MYVDVVLHQYCVHQRNIEDTHRVQNLQESGHQFWYVFEVAVRLFHVEILAKAEISQNIKDKIIDLVSHVQRFGPLAICAFLSGVFEQLDPSTRHNHS